MSQSKPNPKQKTKKKERGIFHEKAHQLHGDLLERSGLFEYITRGNKIKSVKQMGYHINKNNACKILYIASNK